MASNSLSACLESGECSCPQLRLVRERLEQFARTLNCSRIRPSANTQGPSEERIRAIVRSRSLRRRFLNLELCRDPAWDMLLELYANRLAGIRISVTSLCLASSAPSTTALRSVNMMVEQGLAVREADPRDGRRVFLSLSDKGHAVMDRYFQALPAIDLM